MVSLQKKMDADEHDCLWLREAFARDVACEAKLYYSIHTQLQKEPGFQFQNFFEKFFLLSAWLILSSGSIIVSVENKQ